MCCWDKEDVKKLSIIGWKVNESGFGTQLTKNKEY